jgi:MoaA/NifB/PqqE/SkfB family radical SAM enzyme
MEREVPIFQALEVETVNACNRRCWFRKFGQPRVKEVVQFMPWDLIERIIDNLRELGYCNRLSWYKINEPLLDKRIYQILRVSRDRLPGCWLSLVTNGDLLNDGTLRRLLDSGLDVLGVSVYDDQTLQKVASLQSDRLIVLDRRPSAEASFVENRGNNIRLLTDETRTRNAVDFSGRNCLRPSSMMAIGPTGLVSLCCCDLYGDVVMGDVRLQTLAEIWWSDRYRHYRTHLRHAGRRGLALCEDCSYAGWPAPRSWPLGFGPSRV